MTVLTSRHESVVWGVVLWNGCRAWEAVPVLRLFIHPRDSTWKIAKRVPHGHTPIRHDLTLFYRCVSLSNLLYSVRG